MGWAWIGLVLRQTLRQSTFQLQQLKPVTTEQRMTNTLPVKARGELRIERGVFQSSRGTAPAHSATIRHYPFPHQHFGRSLQRRSCWYCLPAARAAGDNGETIARTRS